MGPKPVDTSSLFYRPDQKCAYHSNSIGNDTKFCINIKKKFQDLIYLNVVFLQIIALNINNNPLSNHGGININMLGTDDDSGVTKA